MKKLKTKYYDINKARLEKLSKYVIFLSLIISGCNSSKSNNSNKGYMYQEIEKAILAKASNEKNSQYATQISKEYLKYYSKETESTKLKMSQLVAKYNDKTIEGFLGEHGYPKQYTHMSLGHSMSEKSLKPMLDNDGGIYPPDNDIGYIIKDPEYWTNEETEEHWNLRWKYQGLIFYAWLSAIWIEIEGYNSNIVVKTTENNSVMSWYLNDFQFDQNSKFHLEHDWKSAIEKYNRKNIDTKELIENLMKEYGR